MKRIMGLVNMITYWFFQTIVAIVAVGLVLYIGKMQGIDKSSLQQSFTGLPFFALVSVSTLAIIMIINHKILVEKITYGIKNYKEAIVYGIIGFFSIMFLSVGINIVLKIFNLVGDGPKNEDAVQAMIKSAPFYFSILIIGVLAPFLEEIVFRLSFFMIVTKDEKTKKWYPYILCAIVFALIHESNVIFNFNTANLVNFIVYLAPALVLSIIYRVTNHNLLAVYLVHLLNNTLPLIVVGLT